MSFAAPRRPYGSGAYPIPASISRPHIFCLLVISDSKNHDLDTIQL
jgi:hypothetical protein